MPRKPREEVPGGIHHVFARGNNRQLLYWDDEDRVLYLTLLCRVVRWRRWRCLAYCLMSNHLHLLVETPEPNLGDGMHTLHSGYALLYNRRHRRCGHVFDGRFGSNVVRDDEQLWTVTRYIQRNPVEAGLCAVASEWKWSSHGGMLDGTAPQWLDRTRLLSFFETMGRQAELTYRELIDG
jgi:putative transposase